MTKLSIAFAGTDGAAVDSTAGGTLTAVGTGFTYQSTHSYPGLGKSIQAANPGSTTGATSRIARRGSLTASRILAGYLLNLSQPITADASGNRADMYVLHIAGASGNGGVMTVNLADSPKLLAPLDAAPTKVSAAGVTFPSGTTDVWVVLYLVASTNDTTPNGEIRAAYYTEAGGVTPVWDSTLFTGVKTAAAATPTFTDVRFPKNSAGAYSGTVSAAGPKIYTDADATWPLLPPWAPTTNAPPTVSSAPNVEVAPGATVTLNFPEADDTGVTSRTTTFDYPTTGAPTISNSTAATSSFVAGPAGSLYIVRRRVFDAGGLFAEATTEVYVPADGTVGPIPSTATGSWERVGGAADDGVTLGDGSDATFLRSPTLTSTETEARVRIRPMVDRANGTITVRLRKTDSGTANAAVRVYTAAGQTTPLEAFAVASGDLPVSPAALKDFTFQLSTASRAALDASSGAGWNTLRVGLAGTA